jgi:DivIVA domain-containing protein
VTLAFMLVGIVLIAVIALLAVGRLGELPPTESDRAPLALPEDRPMGRDDVDGVRFAVGMRGYRMDEVDDVLDRLADEVAERDRRIAELEQRVAATAPRGASGFRPPLTDASRTETSRTGSSLVDHEPVEREPVEREPVERGPIDRSADHQNLAHPSLDDAPAVADEGPR